MLRSTSKRVSFSPDIKDLQKLSIKKNNNISSNSSTVGMNRQTAGVGSFPVPKHSPAKGFSSMRLLRRIGSKVARAFGMVSSMRRCGRNKSCSKVSSSNSTLNSRPSFAPLDSYQAEAIEDCIEFINSSGSFQRSNSVSTLSTQQVL